MMRRMQNEDLYNRFVLFFFCFFSISCVCLSLGTARWQSSSAAVLFIHSSSRLKDFLLLLRFQEAMDFLVFLLLSLLLNYNLDKRKCLDLGLGVKLWWGAAIVQSMYFLCAICKMCITSMQCIQCRQGSVENILIRPKTHWKLGFFYSVLFLLSFVQIRSISKAESTSCRHFVCLM